MLPLTLQLVGRLFAHTPRPLLRVLCTVLGAAVLALLPSRRRLVYSNLHHAFPDRSCAWHRRMAHASSRRMIETGLLSLASPFLPDNRLRRIAHLSPGLAALMADLHAHPRPVVFCSPHLAYWEAQTWIGLLAPTPLPEFGVIFRPLRNPRLNAFVQRTRERFGMRLLSRKEGFQQAVRILRARGCVGVLFDQNAGEKGALATFLGRVCATTELPGILADKFAADVQVLYPRRLGFWRIELNVAAVPRGADPGETTLAVNRWLEDRLIHDDSLCASWLWSHNRWRNQDTPAARFQLHQKRDLLAADLAARGLSTPLRRTRIFVRLPNWLGDVVMTLPLLRALRASRPDAELTLIGKAAFAPLLREWSLVDHFEPLPPRGPGYFAHFWRLRRRYPDVYVLFTNSLRGDLEARLTGCRQRFGLLRPGRRRPLLSHTYAVPAGFDEAHHHQLELWEAFLRHFGLAAPLERVPLPRPDALPPHENAPIGLIAGSENFPAKRWPTGHWRALIDSLPDRRFVLFGTAADRALTAAIAHGHAADRVEDLAGRTDLPTYMDRLRRCSLLVTNDTGGMHLANALGVPLIALFGPTNPVRTGPVFTSPAVVLQPPGCPPTGGADLVDLTPPQVTAAILAR